MATHYPPLWFEVSYGTDAWGAPIWIDETARLRRASSERGRQHELQQFDAGKSSVALHSADRRFDPTYAAGPHAGQLVPGVPHRLRALAGGVWYPIFHTFAEKWQPQRPMQTTGQTTLTGVDVFKALRQKSFSSSTWPALLTSMFAVRAYYRLGDPPGSSRLKDQSANHYDGAIGGVGSSIPTLGAAGALVADLDTALHIPKPDGSGGSGNASLPAAVGGLGAGALSMGMWAKCPAGGTSTRITWGHPFGYAPVSQWIFQPVQAEGVYYTDGVNGFLAGSSAFASPNDGRWHFYVWTRDPDGVTNHIYTDGVLKATMAAGFVCNFDPVGALPVKISAGEPGVTATEADTDELFFIKGALSASQVAQLYQEGAGKYAGQSPGQRIGVVLDVLGWSAGDRDIAAGLSTLQAATQLGGTKVLDHLQKVEQTEGGMLFQSADGKVTFYDRHRPLLSPHNSPVATFGDGGGAEIPYEDAPDVWIDDNDVYPEAISTRDGGAPQRAIDQAAEDTYGPATLDRSGLLYSDDNQSLDLSNWNVILYAHPKTRVGAVRVHAGALDSAFWPTLLNLKIGDRVTVKGRPVPKTTAGFSYDQIVEGIGHEFDLDTHEWWMTFQLASAVDVSFWILGASQLGIDSRLAF